MLDMHKPGRRLVKLSRSEKRKIEKLLQGGVQPVRVIKRAQSLRLLNAGQSTAEVATSVDLSAKGVWGIGRRYSEQGLAAALYDRPRPGAGPRIERTQKQRIIAMVCAQPPPGQARWTVRLITEEAKQRNLVAQIGRESIRLLLEQHDLKPWREKNVVYSKTGRGIYREDGRRTGAV